MYETLRILLVIMGAAVFIWSAAAQTAKQLPATPPPQPVPFSHKVHVGKLKQECKLCHPSPDPGERMGIAPIATCLTCHSESAPTNQALQTLASFAKSKREIRWARVYEIPTYVRFSHRAHMAAGSTCVKCHGPVAERDQLYKETDLSMGACMNCHSEYKASIDCTYCHEDQQQN